MNTLSTLVAGCTLAFVAAAAAPPPPGEAAAPPVTTLTVRGEAQLDRPADQLRVRLGVVTEDESASSAMAENSRRMEGVVAAIKRAGLGEREYETGQFSLQPKYSQRPRNAEPDWSPRIVGYTVSNQLSIRTKRLDQAGKILEACAAAGANSIDLITFDLADPRAYRRDAIAEATRNARSDAAALAEAAGVRLSRVISITLDQSDWRPPMPLMNARGMAMAAEVAAPPIAPGDVTVSASVTMVYEITGAAE